MKQTARTCYFLSVKALYYSLIYFFKPLCYSKLFFYTVGSLASYSSSQFSSDQPVSYFLSGRPSRRLLSLSARGLLKQIFLGKAFHISPILQQSEINWANTNQFFKIKFEIIIHGYYMGFDVWLNLIDCQLPQAD